MNARRLAFLAPLALLLAGCGTSPVNPAAVRPIPSDRLLPGYAFYARPGRYGARVVVVRDKAKFDVFDRAELEVDGRPVAILRPGERLVLHVYAGDHILGVTTTPAFLDLADIDRSFAFQPGRTYYFRVGVVGHFLEISPSSPTAAESSEK